MSWIQDTVERLTNWTDVTYIANAYSADIWVSFNSRQLAIDKMRLDAAVGTGGNSGTLGMELQSVSNCSWIKVTYGSVHKKEDRNGKCYVTVVASSTLDQATAARHEASGRVLVFDYEVKQNSSFIVTAGGEFQQQKYGAGNLFLDWSGLDHTPPMS